MLSIHYFINNDDVEEKAVGLTEKQAKEKADDLSREIGDTILVAKVVAIVEAKEILDDEKRFSNI